MRIRRCFLSSASFTLHQNIVTLGLLAPSFIESRSIEFFDLIKSIRYRCLLAITHRKRIPRQSQLLFVWRQHWSRIKSDISSYYT
jgi:hypothetical protein